ncbi:U3 small nucleolar RNA-associated protein [Sporothrix bragantina]|uniref:U3 small nucleolar RNA-associated protein n=1 Tax=Sporothrix bragantina TaxID=671064 RepID=A0ABP0CCW8_9PEZI
MDIHRCRFVPFKAAAINAVAFSHPHLAADSKYSRGAPARMAIGRANGDIEIWNPMHGTWLQETTIPGGQDRSVEGLAWVVGDDEELDNNSGSSSANGNKGRPIISHGSLRLFSIGYTNTITEWDLDKGCAKRHASGQHGELWCLATQPKGPAASAQRLVGGTMDGCLALYTTEDDDLRFQRLCRTPKKSVKIVSIAFQTRQLAVAGCSDGTIRVFDIRNGAILHAMTMGRELLAERALSSSGKGNKGGNGGGSAKNVIVWSVRCLPNGDIVSGDSTGQICIWDGTTYTQAQRIQSHTQDVLSLATSADGSSIVSGGMDRRVVLYREIAGQTSRWAKVWHRRYHQHDVKALAAFEAKGVSVVVAGGPDATPVVLPLQKSGFEHHRTLSHLPQTVPVASAPDARLVICWWERRVEIWAFDTTLNEILSDPTADTSDADMLDRNRRLVGRILIKGDANITAAAISPDGSLVVVATINEVKAFQLCKAPSGELVISKVAVPAAVANKGASGAAISPSGRWVALSNGVENHVTVLEALGADSDEETKKITFRAKPSRLSRLRRSIPNHELFSGLGRYDRRVTRLVFSPDSKLLAVGDLAGYIDTWVLRGPNGVSDEASAVDAADGEDGEMVDAPNDDEEEDSDASSDEDSSDAEGGDELDTHANKWVRNPRAKQMPKLSGAPVVLSFSADVPGAPAVAGEAVDTASSTAARDYVLLAVTATSRLFAFNPLRARLVPWLRRLTPANLPLEFRNIRDIAKGVLWQGPRLWIYGTTFLFMVDTSVEPAPASSSAITSSTDKAGASSTALSTPSADPPKRKRKRGDDTGAGGRMTLAGVGPQRVQMVVESAEGGAGEWVDVDMEGTEDKSGDGYDDDSDDSDDSESDSDNGEAASHAQKLLHQQQQHQQQLKHQKKSPRKTRKQQQQEDEEKEADNQLQKHLRSPQPQQPRWWHTFKYRPILGVVPLAAASSSSSSSTSTSGYPSLEVALIERPGWDIDLPLRYGGDER